MVTKGITTGASNDIEVATNIATNMVTKWGFSDALGQLSMGKMKVVHSLEGLPQILHKLEAIKLLN
jgi:ATP-dependent Zn protease